VFRENSSGLFLYWGKATGIVKILIEVLDVLKSIAYICVLEMIVHR
jgi:hypothetical protein